MSNPFVTSIAVTEQAQAATKSTEPQDGIDPVLGTTEVVFGPMYPATPVESSGQHIGTREVHHTPAAWIVGLHSGCGASSLAHLLEGVEEVTSRSLPRWPTPAMGVEAAPVVLVARTNWIGLQQAELVTRDWAAGRLDSAAPLLGLVLVADAPRPAPELKRTVRTLLHRTPHGWHLPWQEAWRLLPPDDRPLVGAARRTIRNLSACIEKQNQPNNAQ